jgi:hypothetical protein
MAFRVHIYERAGTELTRVGIWNDGTWELDKKSFSDIDNIERYGADLLLDRFDGPRYFAVKERNAPLLIEDIDIPQVPNAKSPNNVSGFVRHKVERVEEYKAGELDRERFSDEHWQRILDWVDYYG